MILVSLFCLVLVLFPLWKILDRMGFNGIWVLICIIPFGAIVGLWILAFQPWPAGGKPPKA